MSAARAARGHPPRPSAAVQRPAKSSAVAAETWARARGDARSTPMPVRLAKDQSAWAAPPGPTGSRLSKSRRPSGRPLQTSVAQR
eukprot:9163013-Pyramimonas_sp.AAC.1